MPLLEALLRVVAPHNCLECGREGRLICEWCQPDFLLPVPSRCFLCRRVSVDSRLCEKCRPKSRLSHVWVRADYTDNPKKLLHAFKFERASAAASVIAAFMSESLPYIPEDVEFVPIPTATSRVRQRGYDQAVLLAKELSKLQNRPYSLFLRRQGQSRQVGRHRKERLEQLERSFWVKGQKLPERVILVDDVLTTGATIESAARVLKRAGVKHVDALVFAQAL